MTRRVALLGWVGALAAAGWLLVQMGHGVLAPPGGVTPVALRDWASSRDAATLAMSLLRLVSLVLDGYLFATTLAGIAARAARSAGAVRALDAVTPRSVRRVLAASMGGLALSFPLASPGANAWPVPAAPVTATIAVTNEIVLAPVPGGPPLVRVTPPATSPSSAPTTINARGAPPAGFSRGGTHPPVAGSAPSPQTTQRAQSGPSVPMSVLPVAPQTVMPATPQVWLVHDGDNFWAIARSVLAARLGRPATPAQIAPFWAAMITLNRDRLRTGNPSLVYAGQTFVIPAA